MTDAVRLQVEAVEDGFASRYSRGLAFEGNA
jgi:hypothetical protein